MDLNKNQSIEYYSRQISIDSFGMKSQRTLSEASCLVVGIGGLGCPASLYLAVSGVGRLGLCDYDSVEMSNLSRQILFSYSDLGSNKASAARRILQDKNPHIQIHSHENHLNETNVDTLISQYDVILDCSDNFHAKYLIHDSALCHGKNLVQASVYQKQGQVLAYAFAMDDFKGCMRCLWPQEPEAACVKSCADAGILSVVAGTVGLRQATSALQLLTGDIRHAGKTSLYSYTSQDWMELALPVLDDCPYCCNTRDHESSIGHEIRNDVEALEITQMQDKDWKVVDVRNAIDQSPFPANFRVHNSSDREIADVSLLARHIDKDEHSVLVCYKGIRSLDISMALRSLGFYKVHSYAGGYERFLANESPSAD